MIRRIQCLRHPGTKRDPVCGSVSVQIKQRIGLLCRTLGHIIDNSYFCQDFLPLCGCIGICLLCGQFRCCFPVPYRPYRQDRQLQLFAAITIFEDPVTVLCTKRSLVEILRLRRQLPVRDPVFSGLSRSIIFPDRVDPDVQVAILIVRGCQVVQAHALYLIPVTI